MAEIKEYKKKNGATAYMFSIYLGVDPLTGKKKRTTRRGFKSLKEARLALARLELAADAKKSVTSEKKKYTFEQVYKMWLEQHRLSVRETSMSIIEGLFKNHINPALGSFNIQAINSHVCQQAVNQWHSKVTTYQKLKAYTSKVFEYAVINQIIDDNPMLRVVTPRQKQKAQTKKFYNKEELQHFFQCVEKDNNMFELIYFRLLAFTGMRKGELHALTWDDISFDTKKVSINKTLVEVGKSFKIQEPKTVNSKRVISIDDNTLSLLKSWKAKQKELFFMKGLRPSQDLVCTNNSGAFLYFLYGSNRMKELEKKYGINPITIHGFRHTHASLLFESGATIKDVQKRLGHADVKTTMNIYTHVTEAREDKTSKMFAEYVNF
ncbi:tyrosine-type recombinase/integrase [Listeria ilorinensis]|uniref:tyrosine-type recombinase/integrase n=1 Tax=Listeria ilorinensis TaxID=2867439 RepID=UPI001EF57884|nr:tyrosine-type recombinase/integrase [Listeria ilorinensis]